jgi:hypothetical protein
VATHGLETIDLIEPNNNSVRRGENLSRLQDYNFARNIVDQQDAAAARRFYNLHTADIQSQGMAGIK